MIFGAVCFACTQNQPKPDEDTQALSCPSFSSSPRLSLFFSRPPRFSLRVPCSSRVVFHGHHHGAKTTPRQEACKAQGRPKGGPPPTAEDEDDNDEGNEDGDGGGGGGEGR